MESNTAGTGVIACPAGIDRYWPGAGYAVDAMERTVLFLDTLRQRGNAYVEHVNAGEPPLLKFEHELVLDGRDLPQPCTYALLHILPPAGHPLDPKARPVVIVDPRAGHGPGIGGFKDESELGVAMRSGHPAYFVTFRPQPEEHQRLLDVMRAEARFLEVVAQRHPQCAAKPLVIGNCQAGWAMAGLAAMRPELFGVVFMVGSPMSYWAGGSNLNPMRYSGATLGGAWLAALAADLGADRFDGAHLVENFEKLNPANTWWTKYFRLWSQVDREAGRFLEFERWWGGFFRMTGAEIEFIVENLFVGNRLARGAVRAGTDLVDLRNIQAPLVVFASWGDNITPPPQALNWIIDTWGDERAIAAAGRVIVYVLHESIGHLGIFVGAEIARKEHDQLVNSLDVIEHLPPGLYEMKVRDKNLGTLDRWHNLEPGTYTVHFEHRTMDALRAINPEGREEEQIFSTVAKVSRINTAVYKKCMRPWMRLLSWRPAADAVAQLHPLRWQRYAFSDASVAAPLIAQMAEHVRARRHLLPDDHPGRRWEQLVSTWVESSLNLYRDLRDHSVITWTRLFFGPLGVGAWLRPDPPHEATAVANARAQVEALRSEVMARIGEGGIAAATCRIVLAAMSSTGSIERRSLRVAQILANLSHPENTPAQAPIDWLRLMREQARILAVAPAEALQEVANMLPDTASRERALAVAAAVMMIEPSLDHPRPEIIDTLLDLLGVDAERVGSLSRRLTAPIAL